jgi:hypothetical protein
LPGFDLDCELAERRTFSQTGGLRWGRSFNAGSNATWPFATLTATSHSLAISVGIGPLGRKFNFSKADIVSLSLKRGVTGIGLLIEHSCLDLPPYILFWTFNPTKLRRSLDALGYELNGDVQAAVPRIQFICLSVLIFLASQGFSAGIAYCIFASAKRGNYKFNGLPISRATDPTKFWLGIAFETTIAIAVCLFGVINLMRCFHRGSRSTNKGQDSMG